MGRFGYQKSIAAAMKQTGPSAPIDHLPPSSPMLLPMKSAIDANPIALAVIQVTFHQPIVARIE